MLSVYGVTIFRKLLMMRSLRYLLNLIQYIQLLVNHDLFFFKYTAQHFDSK